MDKNTIERVKRCLRDPGIGPETIALMLTNSCNLSCVYCRGGRVDDPQAEPADISGELSTEELFRLFEDASRFKVREINLGGMRGEPFCKKDILAIMSKIKQLGLFGSLTTNGSLLNASIAGEISDYGWDIILLSLDSANDGIQYALRPSVNKSEYFRNIIAFLDALEAQGSKLRILLNMVISKLNYRELPAMVRFANSYRNVESINILRLVDMGLPAYGELQLQTEQLREFHYMLESLRNEKKLMYTGGWQQSSGQTRDLSDAVRVNRADGPAGCYTNYYILSIDANGDVLHCPQQYKVVSGLNIKSSSLEQVWKKDHRLFRGSLAITAPCARECCTILKEQNKLIAEELSRLNSGQ